MSHQLKATVEASKLKQLQEAMKNYPFHWLFNPYPVLRSDPEGKWAIGIDYGDAPAEKVQQFERFWATLEAPIKESTRRPSFLSRVKRSARRLFG